MKKAIHFMGRLAYRAIYLAFSLLLILSLLSLGAQMISPEKALPGILGYSQLVVISGSMQPAIDPGDLLVIRQQASYQPGDILTFIDGQSLVTHRLLAIQDGTALTRGDANNTDDAQVALEDVQGRMVLRVPKLGHFVLYLRSSQGMLMLTAVLVLLLAVPLIIRGGSHKPKTHKEGGDDAHDA